MSYVLAVAKSHPVTTAAGAVRADILARRLPRRAWQRLSAGPGATGHRWYHWAWVAIDPGMPGYRHLLVRRHRRTGELACYRCYTPRHIYLTALVRAAGRRWTVEIRHPQCRSSHAAVSWLCSLLPVVFLFGLCPAGSGVEARRAGSAFA